MWTRCGVGGGEGESEVQPAELRLDLGDVGLEQTHEVGELTPHPSFEVADAEGWLEDAQRLFEGLATEQLPFSTLPM